MERVMSRKNVAVRFLSINFERAQSRKRTPLKLNPPLDVLLDRLILADSWDLFNGMF